MTKIFFIAYYYPPVGGAGVQRAYKFASYLPEEAFLPTVIAGPPAVGERWAPADASLMDPVQSRVEVRRPLGPAPVCKRTIANRLRGWVTGHNGFTDWWLRTVLELASSRLNGHQLILATAPPFESAEAAQALSARLGIPWVADLRDPWALDEIQVYQSLAHRYRELTKMKRVLSTAAALIMNTPEARAAVLKALPLKSERVVTIPNGFDTVDFLAPVLPRQRKCFRIVHSGTFLTADGFDRHTFSLRRALNVSTQGVDILTRSPVVLLDALERWTSRCPEVLKEVEVLMAGQSTAADFEAGDKALSPGLLRFCGYLPHSESIALIRSADLLFLPMHNVPDGSRSTTVPGKLYEYMATGRPILGAVPEGFAKDCLEQCGTGFTCRPDDAAAMADIFDRVFVAWKRNKVSATPNGRFVAQFERRMQVRSLADVLSCVLWNAKATNCSRELLHST